VLVAWSLVKAEEVYSSPMRNSYEFRIHKVGPRKLLEAINPKCFTALISVTVNFTDALRRAFEKYYEGDNPARIWIVFVSVPDKDKGTYHRAERLAQENGEDEPRKFKDEYIFEWEIPEKYIVHRVSVQTLLERGLDMERYCMS
jgi:hypothetical protein